MFTAQNNTRETYKQIFEEIFEELVFEGNHIVIEFEDIEDKGLIIKFVNGCNSPNVFREKLFFIKKKALEILKRKLEKLSKTEKILILEFVKIRLGELEETTKKTRVSNKNGGKKKEHFLNCKFKNEKNEVFENINAILIGRGYTPGLDLKLDIFIKEYYKQMLRAGTRDYVCAWGEILGKIEEEIDELIHIYKNTAIEDVQLKAENAEEFVKPIFKKEYIRDIFNVLKDYFPQG